MRRPSLHSPTAGKSRLTYVLVASTAALAVMLAVPPRVGAQEPIESTTELRRACETGDHHVYVTTDLKITSGPRENVSSGCKISLGPGANFEADQVSMGFAGPFEIYSARERSVSFTRSVWEARSLGLYTGAKSQFRNTASLLRATAGDITLIAGGESAIQVQHRPAASVNGFDATGSVSINGGEKLFVDLHDTGIKGTSGVEIHLGGVDGVLKADNAELRSPRGAVTVHAVAPKALVELKGVTLASGGGGATVSIAGSQSILKTFLSRISSQGGGVVLRAGVNGWWAGVELVETTVTASGGVHVAGSPTGRYGTVKVAKSTVLGGSDLVFRTAAFGTTEVKEDALSSATAVRILTGTDGTCTAEKNQYQAPMLQICP